MAAAHARVVNVPLPLEGTVENRLPLIVFLPRMENFFRSAGLWTSVERPQDFDWAGATAAQQRDNCTAVSYLRSALSPQLAGNVEHIPHVNMIWARLTQV